MKDRHGLLLGAALTAFVLCLALLPTVAASATTGTMQITTDTTLTEDHDGNITIGADDVALDCADHVVTGTGAGFGIRVGENRSGVIVKNCEVTNFTNGIHITESQNITLIDNYAHHNGSVGIMLNLTTISTLTGNKSDDNGFGKHATWGFLLIDSDNNELTANTASRNGETNFGLESSPTGSDGNSLTSNTASGGQRGFAFPSASGNTFKNNTVVGASAQGFESDASANNNIITGNVVAASGGTGLRLGGSGNAIADNRSDRNGEWAFSDFSVPGANTYQRNTCTGNGFGGSDPSGLCQEEQVGLVDPSTGVWHLRHSENDITTFYYGNPGDVPFLGDWDCDTVATPGLFRTSDAFAYLRNSNTQGIADIRFFFGNPSDVPLAGDFNGDGCDTLSIYRPSEARFYIVNKLGENEGGLGAAEYSFVFGNPGDKPVVGDWDGDGVDEIGLHRESTGFFYYRNTLTTGNADGQFYFGDPGDRFVAGDWGVVDGVETPAMFRPSNSTFYFRHTLTQGNADSEFVWTGAGMGWLPVSGDFTLD